MGTADCCLVTGRPIMLFVAFVALAVGVLIPAGAGAERGVCELRLPHLESFSVVIAPEKAPPFTLRVTDAAVAIRPGREGEPSVTVDGAIEFAGKLTAMPDYRLARDLSLAKGAVRLPEGTQLRGLLRKGARLSATAWLAPSRSVSTGFSVDVSLRCADLRVGTGSGAKTKRRPQPRVKGDGTRWVPVERSMKIYAAPGAGRPVVIRPKRRLMERVATRGAWTRLFGRIGSWAGIDGWVRTSSVREWRPPHSGGVGVGRLGGLGGLGGGGSMWGQIKGCHDGLRSLVDYRGPAKVKAGAKVRDDPDGVVWALVGDEALDTTVSWVEGSPWIAVERISGFSTQKGRLCLSKLSRAWVSRTDVELLDSRGEGPSSSTPPVESSSPPLEGVVDAAAGVGHSCAVTKAGDLYCWGENGDGQLGDGTTIRRTGAVRIDLGGPAKAVAARGVYSCALRRDGKVLCWGGKSFTGYARDALRPQAVDVAGVREVVVGDRHSCALVRGGRVWCWGKNREGQLGDGTTTDRRRPVRAKGFGGAVAISAGRQHSCALLKTGAVLCWGDLVTLGRSSKTAERLDDIGQVRSLSSWGDRGCAALKGGTVNCWGGIDRLASTKRFVAKGVTGAVEITLGRDFGCARTKAGNVQCWGAGSQGQLGDGSWLSRPVAETVKGLHRVRSVVTGSSHGCAVRSDGRLLCWGRGTEGQLGDPIGVPLVPTLSKLGGDVAQVVAGARHTCVRRATGEVACVGDNRQGQLGDGSTAEVRLEPVVVPGLRGVVDLAAGDSATCVVQHSGEVLCWGSHPANLSPPAEDREPVFIGGISKARAVAVNGRYGCVVTFDDELWCWGALESATRRPGLPSPSKIAIDGSIESVRIGRTHACARLHDGRVACWGSNDGGRTLRRGFRRATDTSLMIVDGLTGVEELTTSEGFTSLRFDDGRVACVGDGAPRFVQGELSIGGGGPRRVPLLNDAATIASSTQATCAARTNGLVACWGAVGPVDHGPLPADVLGLEGITLVAAGDEYVCASDRRRVWCWGDNSWGQLGLGRRSSSATPLVVRAPARREEQP